MTAFISYRRDDSADATGRIYDRLAAYFGREAIFKDVDNLPIGVNFQDYLTDLMDDIGVVLVVIGKTWVSITDYQGRRRLEDPTDFVRLEVELALERNIPIVPLLVGGAQMPKGYELPASIRQLVLFNGIPVRPDPDFHHDMDKLISSLEAYIIVPSMQTKPNQKFRPPPPNANTRPTRVSTPRPAEDVVKEWKKITTVNTGNGSASVPAAPLPKTKTRDDVILFDKPPRRFPFWRMVLLTGAFGWPYGIWVLSEGYFFFDVIILVSLISAALMFAATSPIILLQRNRWNRNQDD